MEASTLQTNPYATPATCDKSLASNSTLELSRRTLRILRKTKPWLTAVIVVQFLLAMYLAIGAFSHLLNGSFLSIVAAVAWGLQSILLILGATIDIRIRKYYQQLLVSQSEEHFERILGLYFRIIQIAVVSILVNISTEFLGLFA